MVWFRENSMMTFHYSLKVRINIQMVRRKFAKPNVIPQNPVFMKCSQNVYTELLFCENYDITNA